MPRVTTTSRDDAHRSSSSQARIAASTSWTDPRTRAGTVASSPVDATERVTTSGTAPPSRVFSHSANVTVAGTAGPAAGPVPSEPGRGRHSTRYRGSAEPPNC
ncbi:hypothetical protein AUW26_23085 [Streptomyces sp. CC71]|nr:hypothetical protein AUW26_23085 [Streptomyces sp. CC71]